MAAPVRKTAGRASRRLARLRRQRRRPPERVRRLRPPRLPGDRVRARVTKVKRGFAEALATEVLEPSPQRVDAPCALPGLRRLPPKFRLREPARGQARPGARRPAADRRIASPHSKPILAAESPFHYRNKLEYSFTETPSGPALGFHKAGRWDEVLGVERAAGSPPTSATRSGTRSRTGRASSSRTTRPSRPATCAISSCVRAEHRPGARPARHRPG